MYDRTSMAIVCLMISASAICSTARLPELDSARRIEEVCIQIDSLADLICFGVLLR
jgi:hypothetical protein